MMAIAVLVLAAVARPFWLRALDDLLWLSTVFLFLFCCAVLAWFFYGFILRRILRARRLANARLARILRENQQAEPVDKSFE